MTVIIDYGVGNLFSLLCSFKKIGEEAIVSNDAEVIRKADRIILPGVGAFKDAKKKLDDSGIIPVLNEMSENKIPIMGICLGMQLLFDKSLEYGECSGLGFIKGEIRSLNDVCKDLKIPHMGWNSLKLTNQKHPLFKYINDGDCVYFVHSYYAEYCKESVIATAEYGYEVTAAVANGNIMGCQFHPEKSGKAGLNILMAFCELKGAEL